MSSNTAARLSAALLARKGSAAPALYRTGNAYPRPVEKTDRPAAEPQGEGNTETRAKLTLRLDHERHRRLKLAAAHTDRSLQDILSGALDDYLAQIAPNVAGGGCSCLAGSPLGDKSTEEKD